MKINREFTYILFAGIAEEGIAFGDNSNQDAVLILEDENGKKIGSEFISLHELSQYMSDIYSEDVFMNLLMDCMNKDMCEDGFQGTIEDEEILSWIQEFRFSKFNKSYSLTEEF